MKTKVGIILVNYKNYTDTIECLASLNNLVLSEEFEIFKIVVDNASDNESTDKIRQSCPDAIVIDSGFNRGFSFANNIGINLCLGLSIDYTWLLNNDTIVDPKSLNALIQKIQSDTTIGAVGSVLYYYDQPQKIQAWGGGPIDLKMTKSVMYQERVDDQDIQFITGASIFFRTHDVLEFGMMNEEYFMYWEDVEFSIKIRNSGKKLAVAGQSKIIHRESSSFVEKTSSRLKTRYFINSTIIFIKNNSDSRVRAYFFGIFLRIIRYILIGDINRFKMACYGVFDFIKKSNKRGQR